MNTSMSDIKGRFSLPLSRPRGGWALAIQVTIAVLTTLGLSTWQVSRGFEKSELRDLYVDRLASAPIALQEFVEGDSYFNKIELVGRFDQQRSFIVAYKRHLGVPGFWVITPFETEIGTFLVNRGWIAMDRTWFHTPVVETPLEQLKLLGVVWPNFPQRSTVGYDGDTWPKRVNRQNVAKMAEITSAFGDEVRLLPDSEAVLTPIHLTFEQGASTHWSYALQWLVIGAIIVLGYWYFALRRPDEDF